MSLVELAIPQDAAELQFGVVAAFADGAGTSALDVTAEVEFGITDWLQIGAEVPLAGVWPDATPSVVGLGDVGIGVLAGVSPSALLLLAVAVEVTVPTGHEAAGLPESGWSAEPGLRAAVDLDPIQLHGSAGVGLGDEVEFEYGLGATLRVAMDWVVALEAAGEVGESHVARLSPGLAWTGVSDLELGVGALAVLAGSTAGWGAVARASFEYEFD